MLCFGRHAELRFRWAERFRVLQNLVDRLDDREMGEYIAWMCVKWISHWDHGSGFSRVDRLLQKISAETLLHLEKHGDSLERDELYRMRFMSRQLKGCIELLAKGPAIHPGVRNIKKKPKISDSTEENTCAKTTKSKTCKRKTAEE